MLYYFFKSIDSQESFFKQLSVWKTMKTVYLKNRIYIEHIFYMGLYFDSVSTCLWVSHQYIFQKKVTLMKWSNKLQIHNVNLTDHRKSAKLLVFLQIWFIAPFWHWRSQDFPNGCCQHDLKSFCETGCNSVLLTITEDIK